MEVEIIDINFLKDLMKKDYFGFSKIVERMMRNAEGLYHYPDEFHLKEYRELFDEKIIEYPFCGEYLNSINKMKAANNKE